MRGPILLGANVGKENLNGLVASDHRWGHIAHGPLVSLFDTPMIIGDREKILQKLSQMKPVAGKPCTFTVPGLFEDKYAELELQPFASPRLPIYDILVINVRQPIPQLSSAEEGCRKEAIATRRKNGGYGDLW